MMKVSDFQFTDPCLIGINFRENRSFAIKEGEQIELKTSIGIDNMRVDSRQAYVSIRIKLGDEGETSPFYLEAEFGAQFRWENDVTEEIVDVLLKQNAPALLLSYARPMISMVTNASRFPTYNIPFINFTEVDC